jgi:arsenate reductase
VVITMGCGDSCPHLFRQELPDWVLDDPVGQAPKRFGPIRDEIKNRVEALVAELTPQPADSGGC